MNPGVSAFIEFCLSNRPHLESTCVQDAETQLAIAGQAATERRSPSAFRTLTTVANSGLPSGESAL